MVKKNKFEKKFLWKKKLKKIFVKKNKLKKKIKKKNYFFSKNLNLNFKNLNYITNFFENFKLLKGQVFYSLQK